MTDEAPLQIEVVSTPRSSADLDALLAEVDETPFIAQLSVSELQRHISNNSARFFYDGETLAGFGAWQPISRTWVEIGPFFVMNQYRDRRLGRRVVETLLEATNAYNQYAVSMNPVVKRMFERLGFQPVGLLRLPLEVQLNLLRRLSPTRLLRLASRYTPGGTTHFIRLIPAV